MRLISSELVQELVELNTKIVDGTIVHPAKLALALEEVAAIAWDEAKKTGTVTWSDIEDVAPSLRIDA